MHFRIMSYNIHRAIGVDRRFRLGRVAGIIEHHSPDILLLQEVDVGVPRSRGLNLAVELARLCGYPYLAVGLNVRLRQGMYGNATLSRFPIGEERNVDLTLPGRKARGCLYTAVELAGMDVPLAVFNLHLGLSFRERPQQVGIMVNAPEFAGLAAGHPCIVAGDFNDWLTRIAPIFTEILGFACVTNRARGYQNAFLTYPSFSPTAGLDKIFVRGPLQPLKRHPCRLTASRVASDHLPVIADLELYG
ncbi:MAG: endonuclease/exonuclease/phosphatase family protein [Thermodesulfobacteriota bacterium]